MSAVKWFQDGQRVVFDTKTNAIFESKPIQDKGTFSVFERVVSPTSTTQDGTTRWLTMLPGFPDGSYGWSKVDTLIQDTLTPRLYVEYVGQGDSDKPDGHTYHYSTMERADLVEAQWAHHGIQKTNVVTFDYSSLVLMELLQRQRDRAKHGQENTTKIEHVLLINGGYFADGHSHPLTTTPLLQTWMGRMGCWMAQHSQWVMHMMIRPLFSSEYKVTTSELDDMSQAITRRNGAMFMSNAAGFVHEHKTLYADRWDLRNVIGSGCSIHVVGSAKDQFEPRQFVLAQERLGPKIDTTSIEGGHMSTSEQPEILARLVDEMLAKK